MINDDKKHSENTLQGCRAAGVRQYVPVWVPYTFLVPEAVLAIDHYSPNYALMRTDDDDYPRFLYERWRDGSVFINVEHDVVPWDGAIDELFNCPEPWCAFSYGESFAECTTTLGCCKFRPEFITKTAGVWEAMLDNAIDRERNPNGLDIRGNPKWKMCDCWLTAWARARGLEVHQHYPAVKNL